MKAIGLFVIFFITSSAFGDEECNTPSELKLKEEYCWAEEVEVVDRVVQGSRNLLNFAKKKLGIAVVDQTEKQKCEYYVCILQQLQLLNANHYPAYESIKEWTKRNVVYFQAIGLMDQLDKCNEALTNSTIREVNFYASQVEEHKSVGYDIGSVDKSSTKEQTTCEIVAEFMDCLSRQNECPVFQYP